MTWTQCIDACPLMPIENQTQATIANKLVVQLLKGDLEPLEQLYVDTLSSLVTIYETDNGNDPPMAQSNGLS
jgi:hypothetical protein